MKLIDTNSHLRGLGYRRTLARSVASSTAVETEQRVVMLEEELRAVQLKCAAVQRRSDSYNTAEAERGRRREDL